MSNTIKVKVGIDGVEQVEAGMRRVGDSAKQAFAKLNAESARFNQVTGQFQKLGSIAAATGSPVAQQVSAIAESFRLLRSAASPAALGVAGFFAVATKATEAYFQRVARLSEELSARLGLALGPGTAIMGRAPDIASEQDRQKLLTDLDSEVSRLGKRRTELMAKLNTWGSWFQDGKNGIEELKAVSEQLRTLQSIRERYSGAIGKETVYQNQLAQANRESSEWLKVHADSYNLEIEALMRSQAPLTEQLKLLEKERKALEELYANTSGASPMGEKARLQIRLDILKAKEKETAIEGQLADLAAREAEATKRQVKEINDAWREQVEHVNAVGRELQQHHLMLAAIEARMRDNARGSTYAGASADAYGQHRLAGMTEQAYGMGGMGAGAIAGIQNAVTMLGTTASQVGNAITSSIGGALDGISSSIEGLIRGTMTWADAFRNVGMAILNSVVTAFAKMIAQMMVSFILQKIFGKAMQQQAMQVGSAWTAAAISASIASYGTAAGVGLGAFLAAQAAGQAATVGMSGFASGGFTGNQPTNAVAGVVHGGEFVFSAPAVRRVGLDNLEAMHDGAKSGTGAGGKPIGIALFDNRREAERMIQENEGWVMEVVSRNRHQFR
ncbi:MAG: hypothetical protein J0M24_10840 [Verrucomicrobia bacterium]|nr:hypothetical protein [Verrucomicrobiota bacterium]